MENNSEDKRIFEEGVEITNDPERDLAEYYKKNHKEADDDDIGTPAENLPKIPKKLLEEIKDLAFEIAKKVK